MSLHDQQLDFYVSEEWEADFSQTVEQKFKRFQAKINRDKNPESSAEELKKLYEALVAASARANQK